MPQPPSSLSNKILLKMSLRITLVFICTCIYAYFHNIEIYDKETLEYSEKYVIARADRESDFFMNAESNVKIIQKDFLRKFASTDIDQAKKRFDEMLLQEKDTVWRAQGIYADYKTQASIAILPTAKFDDTFYKSVVTAFDVASQHGPALRDHYFNTYISMFINDATILYNAELDYSRMNGIKELMIDYECETGASPQNNPERKTFFTNIYFDQSIQKGMLSVGIPIDIDGKWIGGVGHDLLIDEMVKRSDDINLPGSYNIIYNKKGDLIAYKELKSEIEKSGGQLDIRNINDPKIKIIWDSIKNLNPNGASVKSNEAHAYIAAKRISGPDWLFVKVLPIPLVMAKAESSIILVILITLIALAIELIIIHRILRKDVAEPLSDLILATQNIYEEPQIARIPTSRNDELGILTHSFKNMANDVAENKKNLESKVLARTNELLMSNELLIQKNISLDVLNKQKNEFIAIANHDLKNPLSMIMLSVGIIKKKTEPTGNEKLIEKLDIIDSQAKRMLTIISEYLNYIAIEENTQIDSKSEFNLTDYLNYIINQNELAISSKSIQLVKKIDNNIIINSNKNIWGIILENLLSNAIKYSDSGKEISVELYRGQSSILLRISDEGMGIPKEEQHLIFQKFNRLSNKPTGGETSTGLGLAIVKQMVDKIGAKISFESSPLIGTKFLIEFPIA